MVLKNFSFGTLKVNQFGEVINTQIKKSQYFSEILPNGVALDMVKIPAGKFVMGLTNDNCEITKKDQIPQHEVFIQSFYISKYPITQLQYKVIIGENPFQFKGDNYPVECVTWYQAIEYCEKLSKLTGRKYRLPSESEWEYAGRAGTQTPFYCGEVLYETISSVPENMKKENNSKPVDDVFGCLGSPYLGVELLANFQFDRGFHPALILPRKSSLREGRQTTPVGSFLPNDFGIYDMHGNVWEWCEDLWHNNYEGAPIDGSAWIIDNNSIDRNFLSLFTSSTDNSCDQRVVRGGSWCSESKFCRIDYRNFFISSEYNHTLGFRVCCSIM